MTHDELHEKATADLVAWFSMHIDLAVPRQEDRMKMHAILDELVLLRGEAKHLELVLGDDRVSGEPIVNAIRKLRDERDQAVAELRELHERDAADRAVWERVGD